MCTACWDADKKALLIQANEACEEILVPFMTINDLKSSLFKEWLETGKTNYRIYKNAIFDPPGTSLSWMAVKPGKDGLAEKQEHIRINFL